MKYQFKFTSNFVDAVSLAYIIQYKKKKNIDLSILLNTEKRTK